MKIIVWGPDGIPIQEEPFANRPEAESGIRQFVERFRSQGYYAGVGFRLLIDEIGAHCQIDEVPEEGSEEE